MKIPGSTSPRQELGLTVTRLTWRRIFVRLVAIASCLIAIGGIGASAYAYRQVGGAERVAQEQLLQISTSFADVAASTQTVSASIDRAAVTVEEARGSLQSASQTTNTAAKTLEDTARVIDFTIPGFNYRPLEGVDASFREQARQLRLLAGDIDRTGAALGRNVGDLHTIGKDVTEVSRDLDHVSTQLRDFSGRGSGPGGLANITRSTRLILTWSIIVHLLLFGLGIALYLLTTEPRYVIYAPATLPSGGGYDLTDLEAELATGNAPRPGG